MKKVADYPEALVPILLTSLFSRLSRDKYYLVPLTQAQENISGYDAELRGPLSFTPVYMQFKRPSAYSPESKRADIILKRKRLGIQDHDDVLFFKLHPKKTHHLDFQHNILYNLGQDKSCVAAYICPIFLKAEQYRSAVNMFTDMVCMNWHGEAAAELIEDNSWIGPDMSLVLNTHAAIKPHKTVTTSKHQYSFDLDCKNVVFHSPEKVENHFMGLAGLLGSTIQELEDKKSELEPINSDSSVIVLMNLVAAAVEKNENSNPFGYVFGDSSDDDLGRDRDFNSIKYWIKWGAYLEANYGIRQYGLFQRL